MRVYRNNKQFPIKTMLPKPYVIFHFFILHIKNANAKEINHPIKSIIKFIINYGFINIQDAVITSSLRLFSFTNSSTACPTPHDFSP